MLLQVYAQSPNCRLGANCTIKYDIWNNTVVARGSIFAQETPVGSLLSDLVGYMLSPEWIRIVVYFSYWIIGGYLFFSYRNIARLQS